MQGKLYPIRVHADNRPEALRRLLAGNSCFPVLLPPDAGGLLPSHAEEEYGIRRGTGLPGPGKPERFLLLYLINLIIIELVKSKASGEFPRASFGILETVACRIRNNDILELNRTCPFRLKG